MKLLGRIYRRLYPFIPYILRLELEQWRIRRNDSRRIKTVKRTIEIIEARWPDVANKTTDRPVFIFAAGWRSGSTLVQRLVMSGDQVIIWGEPYTQCNILENQISSITSIANKYPVQRWFLDNFMVERRCDKATLSERFIANLYPDFRHLKEAHRSFFTELFSSPALQNGFQRWGIKEVRLGIDAAYYFKWLFPNAKFLFVYRNPYEAYASLKPNLHTWSLYTTWPEAPVRTPYRFGKHWARLVRGYLDGSDSVDGLVIKYEELCTGRFPLDKLEEYLELKIDRDILEHRVGATKNKTSLTGMETLLLKRAVNPLARELGYTPE